MQAHFTPNLFEFLLELRANIAACVFDEPEATSPGFLDDFADACRLASPHMEFLTTAVGLPY